MSSTPSQRSITSAQMLPLLQSLPFLNGVSDERLQSLGEQAQVLSFTQGQPVCRRHASQRQLLLVLKGQVRLVVFSDQLTLPFPS